MEANTQHVDDLRKRVRLLAGDRRAHIEVLESSKMANVSMISALSESINEMRKRVSQSQFCHINYSATLNVQQEHSRIRKIIDSLREQSKVKAKALRDFSDAVKELTLETKRPSKDTSPITRNIRMLENRLDKALIKYNEAQSIRKTYEQIVRRLREERVGFDHQLATLDQTCKTKLRDYEELLLLSGDANHAREVAQSELEHVRAAYDEEHRHRGRELRDRHRNVQLRKRLIEKNSYKRQESHGDRTSEDRPGHGDYHQCVACENSVTQRQRIEQSTKIDIFEAAFRRIKDATGVSDVNDVIKKISSQETTMKNLTMLTDENHKRIEVLHEFKAGLKAHVEDIKYAAPGGGHRRKLVDAREEKLSAAASRIERGFTKYERLARTLIAAKAGVTHLQEKLAGLYGDRFPKPFELSDGTLVELVGEIERVMTELKVRVFLAAEGMMYDTKESKSGAKDNVTLRTYNRRIELPVLEACEDGLIKDENFLNTERDDELTRDKVKRASMQVFNRRSDECYARVG